MKSIVQFIVGLLTAIVAAAEAKHEGQEKAGEAKKAYAADLLASVLAQPAPTFAGVPASVMRVVWYVMGMVLPKLESLVFDKIVTKLNQMSFFSSIGSYVDEFLESLNNTLQTTTTQTASQ